MANMKQKLAAAVAAAALAVGAAFAQMPNLGGPLNKPAAGDVQLQMIVNSAKGYTIGYPAGWTVINDPSVDYGFLAPDQSAFCMANSAVVPELASVSNADLQQALSVPLGEQFWDSNFFSDLPNKKYLHVGANPNHPGGWPVQTVEATADITVSGQQMPATFAGIMTFKSSTVYQIMCFSPTPAYPNAKGSVNAILNSFKVTKS